MKTNNASPILTNEHQGSMHGVSGLFSAVTIGGSNYREGTFTHQVFTASRTYNEGKSRLTVKMRFDDQCRNGRNSFSVTGEGMELSRGKWQESFGGCCHDEISKVFHELAPLIKWHLTSSDGPMHYLENTVYHAGDRDHNGLRAGETRQIRNGKTGKLCWKLESASNLPHYVDSDSPTASLKINYVPLLRVGEGKERNLAAARSCAVWPESTDEQLCADPDELRRVLLARLPALLADFRRDIEAAGFYWSPECVAK
jgi:hypothetical protein